jgi:hypothetical protein
LRLLPRTAVSVELVYRKSCDLRLALSVRFSIFDTHGGNSDSADAFTFTPAKPSAGIGWIA